jgi:hypothetical protein
MWILFLKQFVGTVSYGLHNVSRQYNEDIFWIKKAVTYNRAPYHEPSLLSTSGNMRVEIVC